MIPLIGSTPGAQHVFARLAKPVLRNVQYSRNTGKKNTHNLHLTSLRQRNTLVHLTCLMILINHDRFLDPVQFDLYTKYISIQRYYFVLLLLLIFHSKIVCDHEKDFKICKFC